MLAHDAGAQMSQIPLKVAMTLFKGTCARTQRVDTAESSKDTVQRNMCKDSNELIPLKVARAQSVLGLNESIPLKVAESLFKGTRVKTQ